jgi:hypothetical protein
MGDQIAQRRASHGHPVCRGVRFGALQHISYICCGGCQGTYVSAPK